MNILYINYWSIDSGLTRSTVIPNLQLLSQHKAVTGIYFFTVEDSASQTHVGIEKTVHYPLFNRNVRPGILKKIVNFYLFIVELRRFVRANMVDYIICRGAMAGALGWMAARKRNIPLVVESFEPHAQYMLNGGTWKKNGMRFIFQAYFEEKQKRFARWLLPVSPRYADLLIQEGISDERIITVPCSVDPRLFYFDDRVRNEMRERFSIAPDVVAGIYLGQFGDIYFGDEAFEVFEKARTFFQDNYFQIILTPVDHKGVSDKLRMHGFLDDQFVVTSAPRPDVIKYLCAADFAYTLVKTTATSEYCCPVKDGEYWAAGLPVLIPEKIGVDSEIIEENNAGAVLKRNEDIFTSFRRLESILQDPQHRQKIARLVSRYRSGDAQQRAYDKILLNERLVSP